jgi:hypothetical protein
MEMTLNTPALLFPAVSVLLLAYTNRFLGLSNVIRSLHREYQQKPDEKTVKQIANLRQRLVLIRNMQTMGISSLVMCTICMLMIYLGWAVAAQWLFGVSIVTMALSLTLSIIEIQMQGEALNILLSDMEAALRAHEDD